jgi:hypothetical protein
MGSVREVFRRVALRRPLELLRVRERVLVQLGEVVVDGEGGQVDPGRRGGV